MPSARKNALSSGFEIGKPTEAKISLKHGSSDVGLALEVRVSGNAVTRENGACSISHVIWENQRAH